MFKKMLSVLLVTTLIFGGGTSVRAGELENPEEGFEIDGEFYEALDVTLEMVDAPEYLGVGQEVSFDLSITNPNDRAVEHVFTGLGRLNHDEGCFELFTDIEESDAYEIVKDLDANQYDAYIERLGAGETVTVRFTGSVWESWAGQDVDIIAATFVQPEAVNGGDFYYIDEQCITASICPWTVEREYTLDGESVDLNDIPSIFPGQELTYSFTVSNVTEVPLEHVWVGCGVYDPEGRISEIIATESDEYAATENGAYIALIEAGEEITVEFACVIDETWARAEEICFVNGVTQTVEEPYDAEAVRYEYFFDANHILEPLKVELKMDAPEQIATGREVTFTASITNPNSFAVNHVFTGLGKWNDDKGCFELFTDIEESDEYKIYKDLNKNQYDAYIESIDAGKSIKVTFKGVIKDEWAGKKADFVLATFIQPEAVNSGDFYFIDEQAITASVYKMESNTNNSINKEEVLAKPVDTITVVKDEETQNAVKTETVAVVENILNDKITTDVVDKETSDKIKEAVESGKNITTELIVDEIKEEQVASIKEEIRVEIEKEATAKLGADTKVQYMDICIMLKAEDSELGTLNKLQEEIAITIAIPKEIKGENYLYKVIRNHNGEITTLETKDNGDGTITFMTDRFSTYALAYSQEITEDSNAGSSDAIVQPPKTGDSSMTTIYVLMLACGIMTMTLANKKRILK